MISSNALFAPLLGGDVVDRRDDQRVQVAVTRVRDVGYQRCRAGVRMRWIRDSISGTAGRRGTQMSSVSTGPSLSRAG